MADPSCIYSALDVFVEDGAFICVEDELIGGFTTMLPDSTAMEQVFADYDSLAFKTADVSLSSCSDDLLGASDVAVTSKGCTPAAAEALRSCRNQWQTSVSAMVTGDIAWTNSTSTCSASNKDNDTMTDGEGCEQAEAAAPVVNTTPRSVRKVRSRRTNRQRATTPQAATEVIPEQTAAAAAGPPVYPSAATAHTGLQPHELLQVQDFQSMSGVLRPLDAVKDYRTSGSMSLQQLNARIRGSCLWV